MKKLTKEKKIEDSKKSILKKPKDKDAKNSKDTKDAKNSKDTKDAKNSKDTKKPKDGKGQSVNINDITAQQYKPTGILFNDEKPINEKPINEKPINEKQTNDNKQANDNLDILEGCTFIFPDLWIRIPEKSSIRYKLKNSNKYNKAIVKKIIIGNTFSACSFHCASTIYETEFTTIGFSDIEEVWKRFPIQSQLELADIYNTINELKKSIESSSKK